ncbi:TPA: hypothetical protein VGS89_002282 [Vibrio cholerae]|nr:hypothetical protein [Vibrio cholerae]
MSGVFYSHFMKESKNFPRDVAKDIAIYGVEKVSSDIRSRCEKVFNYNFFIKVNKKTRMILLFGMHIIMYLIFLPKHVLIATWN